MATKHGRVDNEPPIPFVQSAVANVYRDLYVDTLFSALSIYVYSIKTVTTSSNLELVHEAYINPPIIEEVIEGPVFFSNAIPSGTLNVNASNTLTFSQETDKTLTFDSITQELNFQQEIDLGQPIYVSVRNYLEGDVSELDEDELLGVDPYDSEAMAALIAALGINQTVTHQKRHYEDVTSYLSLSQEASSSYVLEVSTHIHLSQWALNTEYDNPTSFLYFTQTAEAFIVNYAIQTLELETEAIGNVYRDYSVSSSLSFVSSTSYTISGSTSPSVPTPDTPVSELESGTTCEYTLTVGSSDGTTYTPPSSTPPTLTRRLTTVLTWPYAAPALTVELVNPDFDNVEQFEFRRINRRTRGGTLDFYRNESWIKSKKLIMSFTGLTEVQRNQLIEFCRMSIGTEIGLLDFESRQWRGLLLTPTSPLSEDGRIGYGFSLEFEGELV